MKTEKFYFSFFGNKRTKECFARNFSDLDNAKYFTSCNATFETGFFRGTTTKKLANEKFQELFLRQYGFPVVLLEK